MNGIDPTLNCAAEICCSKEQAMQARVKILCDLGCPDELAPKIAAKMPEMGIGFTSTKLNEAIAEIAHHPGRFGAA